MIHSDDYIDTLRQRFDYAASKRPAYWQVENGMLVYSGFSLGASCRQTAWFGRVLDCAKKSPTAQQALWWAAAHGLDLRVVRSLKNAFGEYAYDGNINLLYRPHERLERVVDTLVHEIRHAWQDHYGLLQSDDGKPLLLSDKLTMQALYEADALAMGRLARKECITGVVNVDAFLEGNFRRWFEGYAQGYHKVKVKHHLKVTRVPLRERLRAAFGGAAPKTPKAYAVVNWQDYLHKLGRKFDGNNYMSQSQDLRDFIAITVLPRGQGLKQYASDAGFESLALDTDKRERMAVVRQTRTNRCAASGQN